LVPSKKFLPGPHVEFVHDTRTSHVIPAAPVRYVPDCQPRTSLPRAPPA
jgi:hypothetical protein